MVRVCNTGWVCNVFRNIDPDFIVHYFVHCGESCNFAPQFQLGPVQIVQETNDCTGFSLVAAFYKSDGSPLYSFNIVAMLLIMWVPHTEGIFQTRTNEGKVGLTFNILWTGIKITFDETKGPVSLRYSVIVFLCVKIGVRRCQN